MGLGDSALSTIVHNHLHELLPDFYPTTVTIQSVTITQKASGEVVETWSDWLTGLTGNFASNRGTEIRGGEMTVVTKGWALNLAGHYPQIQVGHRAVVNGTSYNIVSVVHDSLSESTRLDLEEVTF